METVWYIIYSCCGNEPMLFGPFANDTGANRVEKLLYPLMNSFGAQTSEIVSREIPINEWREKFNDGMPAHEELLEHPDHYLNQGDMEDTLDEANLAPHHDKR